MIHGTFTFKILLFLAALLTLFTRVYAQEAGTEARSSLMAIGLGLEINQNAPEGVAGALALSFDYNLPIPVFPFAAGITITSSNNFDQIYVTEFSASFRWYVLSTFGILGNGHEGLFAQFNAGGSIIRAEETKYEKPLAFNTELKTGYRFNLGTNFYVEPYARFGHPALWGAGFMGGIRLPFVMRQKPEPITPELITPEPITPEPITPEPEAPHTIIHTVIIEDEDENEIEVEEEISAENLAAEILAIFEDHGGGGNTTVEVTDEGIRISLQNIRFMPDSPQLHESEMWKIDEAANILRTIPNVRILVAGHAARAGTAESMLRLSRERAENIAAYLVAQGAVNAANVTTVGYGYERPIADNNTPEGMAANRRIEITILED